MTATPRHISFNLTPQYHLKSDWDYLTSPERQFLYTRRKMLGIKRRQVPVPEFNLGRSLPVKSSAPLLKTSIPNLKPSKRAARHMKLLFPNEFESPEAPKAKRVQTDAPVAQLFLEDNFRDIVGGIVDNAIRISLSKRALDIASEVIANIVTRATEPVEVQELLKIVEGSVELTEVGTDEKIPGAISILAIQSRLVLQQIENIDFLDEHTVQQSSDALELSSSNEELQDIQLLPREGVLEVIQATEEHPGSVVVSDSIALEESSLLVQSCVPETEGSQPNDQLEFQSIQDIESTEGELIDANERIIGERPGALELAVQKDREQFRFSPGSILPKTVSVFSGHVFKPSFVLRSIEDEIESLCRLFAGIGFEGCSSPTQIKGTEKELAAQPEKSKDDVQTVQSDLPSKSTSESKSTSAFISSGTIVAVFAPKPEKFWLFQICCNYTKVTKKRKLRGRYLELCPGSTLKYRVCANKDTITMQNIITKGHDIIVPQLTAGIRGIYCLNESCKAELDQAE